MPVTIADVARRAGVGRGTVSRVLNDRPNVDPETRARIQAVIDELDFVPSATARRLSLGRTQTVAVVVPFIARPSAAERLRGIEAALVEAGLDMMAMNVESVDRRDAILRGIARPERIDGLVLVSIVPHEEELARITAAGLPVVLVDAHHRSIPRVLADDLGGGRLAAEHLLALGHRVLGFVGDTPRTGLGIGAGRLRLRGTRQALRAHDLAIAGWHLRLGEQDRAVARAAATEILRADDRPTAIITASGTHAIAVMEAASGLGLRVPQDLSVIGGDDTEAADLVGLTTIHAPLGTMGARAVARLVSLIGGAPAGPARDVLPVTLAVRGTTAPPPG